MKTRILTLAVAILGVAMLQGCAAPKATVRANLDPSANLASYRTYGFFEQLGTDRGGYKTPLTSYFKAAVSREMEARGYTLAQGNPDLLVNFNANAQEKVDVRSTPTAAPMGYYGYRGGYYGGYAGYPYGGTEVQTVRYKVGTVNIDIVDARRKQLVWEGLAEGRLTKEIMANPQAAVDGAVRLIFGKYPLQPPAPAAPAAK